MHSSWPFGQHSGATENHLVCCWRCGWEHLLCLRANEYWQQWCLVRSLGLCRLAVCPNRQRFYSASCFRSELACWLLEIIWKRWTHQHQGILKDYDSFLLKTLVSVLKADQNNLFGTRGTLLTAVIRKPFHSIFLFFLNTESGHYGKSHIVEHSSSTNY